MSDATPPAAAPTPVAPIQGGATSDGQPPFVAIVMGPKGLALNSNLVNRLAILDILGNGVRIIAADLARIDREKKADAPRVAPVRAMPSILR